MLIVLMSVSAFAVTATEILQRVDQNAYYTTLYYEAKMIINDGRRTIEKTFRAWVKGDDKAYLEFTDPIELGNKVLKLGENLWIYTPGLEQPQIIAGHMRKSSFADSDFSYEDATENNRLLQLYDAVIEGTEEKQGKTCWKLLLTAKNPSVLYYQRVQWVDQATYTVMYEELRARSGRVVKTIEVQGLTQVGNIWFPTIVKIDDKARVGKYTIIESQNIRINQPVSDAYFSLSRLSQ